MNRTDIMNSIALKKRFCKDCNLPITVFDNPYFHKRLCTLDIVFNCVDRFEDFCEELKKFKNEQEYFEFYNKIKDSIIDYIKNNDNYIKFIDEDFKTVTEYNRQILYTKENDGKTFISLDMKKANFSSLHHYSSEIFKNCSTWEEFVKTFTESEHIIKSKYIRQVIMGACNPKKQIQYERYLMNELLKSLHKAIPTLQVFSLGDDEIILNTDECEYCLKDIYKILKSHPVGRYIKLTMFDLNEIPGTEGWIKQIYNLDTAFDAEDKVEFKCLNADVFHQIVKHYFNEVIEPNDLVFYHNGELATYLKEVENPWKS